MIWARNEQSPRWISSQGCRAKAALRALGCAVQLLSFALALAACGQSGSLDTSFNPGTGTDEAVYSVVVQPDGHIVIGGLFSIFNGASRTNLARLDPGGSLDPSFDPGAAVGSGFPYVNAVVSLADGRILAGGSFSGDLATNLVRLNTNGTVDTSFSIQTDDAINALAAQTNGAVFGGFFTEVNGVTHSNIARLEASGAVDSAFRPALQGDLFASVFALALQADGKVLVGGSFTHVNSTEATNLARLNQDGTPDTTFGPVTIGGGQLSSAVYALAVDAQGRVLAGGDFSSANGTAHKNIVRFNPDGTIDSTFNALASTDSAINCLAVQPDGKILIGGYFTAVNGVARNYIARLNAEGTLDATFDPGAGPDAVVFALALQDDARILIAGAFANVGNQPRAGIARLLNTLTTPSPELINPGFASGAFEVQTWTVAGKNYTLQFKEALSDSTWTSLTPVIGTGGLITLTDPSAKAPQRFYQVQAQ